MDPLKWAFGKLTNRRRIVIIPVVQVALGRHALWWAAGAKVAQQEAMQVVGDFNVANSTSAPVHFVEARLRVWLWRWEIPRHKTFPGLVTVNLPGTHVVSPQDRVLPGQTTTARAMWIVRPPFGKPGQSLVASVCFLDSFGRKHWTSKLSFSNLDTPP